MCIHENSLNLKLSFCACNDERETFQYYKIFLVPQKQRGDNRNLIKCIWPYKTIIYYERKTSFFRLFQSEILNHKMISRRKNQNCYNREESSTLNSHFTSLRPRNILNLITHKSGYYKFSSGINHPSANFGNGYRQESCNNRSLTTIKL